MAKIHADRKRRKSGRHAENQAGRLKDMQAGKGNSERPVFR
jgi:hypothetical protein